MSLSSTIVPRTTSCFLKILTFGLSFVIILSTTGGAGGRLLAADGQSGIQAQEANSNSKLSSIDVTGKQGQPANVNLKQLPAIIDIPQTPESIEKVAKLEDEGEKYFQQHILDKALAKWQEAYGLSLEMKYAEGEGRALTNMCRIFLERGQMVKAKYMGENAIEVLSGVSDQRALGRAHLYLAQAYFGLDNPVWAGQQLEFAMKSFSASAGNNARDTAATMMLAASVLISMGKVKESIQFFEAAATYYTQAGDNARAIASRLRVVDILLSLGLLTAAQEEAEKAVSLARANSSQPDNLLAPMSALANCKYTLGEYERAKELYGQVQDLAQKMNKQQLNEVGRSQIDLGYGSTLFACGDINAAKRHLERALPVFKSAGLSLPQSQTASALGVLEESQGNHEKAIELFGEALDLHNLITPKNDNFHMQLLANLAAVECRVGRHRDARARLETASAQAKKLKNEILLARLYEAAAEVALKSADQVQTEQLLKEAMEVAQKIEDDSVLWRVYTLLAKIELTSGNTAQARHDLTSACSFFRSPQAGLFPSPECVLYPTSREDLAEELVAMLVSQGMTEQALLTCEQLKEESLIESWLQHGGQVRSEDLDIYSDLVNQRAHLHAAEVSSPPSTIIKEWQSWMTRFRSLTAQNRALARLIAPIPMTTGDVIKMVQSSHATILEYLMGSDSTVVFTVNNNGHIAASVLAVGRKRLSGQVSALMLSWAAKSEGKSRPAASEKQTLEALASELVPSSVESLLPENPNQIVVIIPDGILFNLPFAALINHQGKYFIEQHTISMAVALGVLLDSPPRYVDDFSLVVASSQGGSENSQDDEAALIAGLFEPEFVTRLIGRDADMKSLQEQVKGKAVVHIVDDLSFAADNPLHANLPLAYNRGEKSSTTSCDHLFSLNLPSDLLIWSGTAVNAKDRDGTTVKVFTRGLNYAGVRNVLMSFWIEPYEQRTSELIDFYKNKQAGLNQAESLRKAELAALAKDASIRSWAAFQLVGPGY